MFNLGVIFMKVKFIFFSLTIVLILTSFAFSQDKKSKQAIKPILIGKDEMSGLDLPKVKLKAHPTREYFQKALFRGEELSIFILASETANNKIASFGIEEFVYFANGKADITMKDGSKISFLAQDYIFVPKGFAANWKNIGNKYHLELSVISRMRSDKKAVSKVKKPMLLDREKLAGIGLTKKSKTTYSDTLYSGLELEIVVEAEEPTEMGIVDSKREQFINVLSGKVTVQPQNGKAQTFHTGDFFVLPKGFTGSWKSVGANLFRTLRVMQVNK